MMNARDWKEKLEKDQASRDGFGILIPDTFNEEAAEYLAAHDKVVAIQAMVRLFEEFDEYVKSTPRASYYWSEVTVEARKIAERLTEEWMNA